MLFWVMGLGMILLATKLLGGSNIVVPCILLLSGTLMICTASIIDAIEKNKNVD